MNTFSTICKISSIDPSPKARVLNIAAKSKYSNIYINLRASGIVAKTIQQHFEVGSDIAIEGVYNKKFRRIDVERVHFPYGLN